MLPENIKLDSDKICSIYKEYSNIHSEAEKLKKEIKYLQDRLSIFTEKTSEIREKENKFYQEIAEKYDVDPTDVKKFVVNAILKIKS